MPEPFEYLQLVALKRINDMLREVGVLVIAFAPIDAILANDRRVTEDLIGIFGIGVLLFADALLLEALRKHFLGDN